MRLFGQKSMTTPRAHVLVRWAISRDLPEILEIENESFEFPWTREDYLGTLRRRNVIALVAERNESILGYAIYELLKTQLHLLNFAVAPKHRHTGIGYSLVERMKKKILEQRRTSIVLEVRETNLDAQLFFQSQGFAATNVLRKYYDDTTDDAYRMCYGVDE
jgi:ribosomal-protein-alanine N-acetyltransferase